MSRVRVAQWATGPVGRQAILGVLDAPGLELVAARVFSEDKYGRDVGELVGRPPLGITATTSTEELLAAHPDVVVYTPRIAHVEEVCELLRAGVDVATTAFCFHPARMSTPDRDALQAACLAGASTLHGSGLNPGSFSAAVPLALSGLVRELRSITLTERADWSVYESTRITFDVMRFGRPAAEVNEASSDTLAFNSDLFQQQVWLLGDALHADLDEVVTEHDVAVSGSDQQVFDRVLEAGTVNAQRWRWRGRSNGVDRVTIDAMWTVGTTDADWPTADHGWTVVLEGDPCGAGPPPYPGERHGAAQPGGPRPRRQRRDRDAGRERAARRSRGPTWVRDRRRSADPPEPARLRSGVTASASSGQPGRCRRR